MVHKNKNALPKSKVCLEKFAQVGKPAHATPVATSRQSRPTHWLNFSQNPKSKIGMTSTASEQIRWTTADLELFPDDGKRYEIIEGELFVTRAPHWKQLKRYLYQFCIKMRQII